MDQLKYPIGIFQCEGNITAEQLEKWIKELEEFPSMIRVAVKGLSEEQLNTPYREGGWTIRQVVHHVADSHMNSFIRFKLTLTEDQPTIKPYYEDRWAELGDSKHIPIELSLDLLDHLHKRWVLLLRSMKESDFDRTFHHPESGETSLARNTGIYAWHGQHHLAHITKLCERMGWSI